MSRRSIMQVAVHTLSSVPSSAFKDSTPAITTNRGPPPPHRVRLFLSFFTLSCFTVTPLCAEACYVMMQFLLSSFTSLFVALCTLMLFSHKDTFCPHRRRTLKTQKWRWWVDRFYRSAVIFLISFIFAPESQNNSTVTTTNSLSECFTHFAMSNMYIGCG